MKKIVLLAIFSVWTAELHELHAVESKKTSFSSPSLAGGVVRSEKWIIRRDKGEEEFEGNVSYNQGGHQFKADWALYRKNLGRWDAKKNIYGSRLWPDGSRTQCYGDSAEFFQESLPDGRQAGGRSIVYAGESLRVKLIHEEPSYGIWNSLSDKAVLEQKNSTLHLSGNVFFTREDMQSWSDTAIYDNLSSTLFLTGGPPVMTGIRNKYDLAMQAESITLLRYPEKITGRGNVRGWVRRAQKPTGETANGRTGESARKSESEKVKK
ncbi:MAG: hypothetical protein ABIG11_00395 [bacterium]